MASSIGETLRNILIMTGGSRGDVQPFIALASGLMNAGYNVAVLTNHDHKAFVEKMGITCMTCFVSAEETLKKNERIRDAMLKGDVHTFLAGCKEVVEDNRVTTVRDFMKSLEELKPDLIVSGSCVEYFGFVARYKLKIPTIDMRLQACVHNPKRMCLGMPTLPFGMHRYLLHNVICSSVYKNMKPFDEEFKKQFGFGVLNVYSKDMCCTDLFKSPFQPRYILQSAHYKEVLYPDSHCNFKLIGQCVVPAPVQQGAQECFGNVSTIEKFIVGGTKPIYCGWGSMTCQSAEFMVEMILKALMHSKQRAIVLGGWAGLSEKSLRRATQDENVIAYAEKHVLFVEQAPHEWLFPQVACTVHHGGAGTLAAATRAGVPTIVTPIWLDQWDHAHLVNELGVGIGMSKQLHKTTAQELGDAIKIVVHDQAMAAKAMELGRKLRAESGVQAGVSCIEQYWTDWVRTGKNNAHVQQILQESSATKQDFGCFALVTPKMRGQPLNIIERIRAALKERMPCASW